MSKDEIFILMEVLHFFPEKCVELKEHRSYT